MPAETRFAQTAAGPVAFRVDGAGPKLLVVVADRAEPYGSSGRRAYDAFADSLAAAGWQAVLVLDGLGPGAGPHAGPDERAAAIHAVGAALDGPVDLLLGVGGGVMAAALATAAHADLARRLVLYGRLDEAPAGPGRALAAPRPGGLARARPNQRGRHSAEELERELRIAGESVRVARELWTSLGIGKGSDAAGPPADLEELLGRPEASDPGADATPPSRGLTLTGRQALETFGRLVERPERLQGGLAALMRQVASLEEEHGAGEAATGDALASIAIPTVVAEVPPPEAEAWPGIGIAARIPGARHRTFDGEPPLPWGDGVPTPAFLALLADSPAGRAAASSPHAAGAAPEATEAAGAVRERVLATLLFTDIVASTERLAKLGDAGWRELLERHHAIIRRQLDRFGGSEVDTAGDGFLASFSTPAPGIRCALAAIGELAAIGLAIRCGLHTGECERIGGKLGGIAVHIGARIAARAGAGEVLVSGTVRDLVSGSGIGFADRGAAELKGVPGSWPIFQVIGDQQGGIP